MLYMKKTKNKLKLMFEFKINKWKPKEQEDENREEEEGEKKIPINLQAYEKTILGNKQQRNNFIQMKVKMQLSGKGCKKKQNWKNVVDCYMQMVQLRMFVIVCNRLALVQKPKSLRIMKKQLV